MPQNAQCLLPIKAFWCGSKLNHHHRAGTFEALASWQLKGRGWPCPFGARLLAVGFYSAHLQLRLFSTSLSLFFFNLKRLKEILKTLINRIYQVKL